LDCTSFCWRLQKSRLNPRPPEKVQALRRDDQGWSGAHDGRRRPSGWRHQDRIIRIVLRDNG
jgi:hypothetical protein